MRSKTKNSVKEVVKHFASGNIIVFPTDTLYGIGCTVSNETAIRRLYSLRKTPLSKPSLILASGIEMAKKYGYIEKNVEHALKTFWPGPLTIVVKARSKNTKIVQGKTNKIAIRVPKLEFILNVIEELGEPILAPSANFPGEKAPVSFDEIDKRIISLVDYAIDLGKSEEKLKMAGTESNIIDLSKKPYKLTREGAISKAGMEKVFKELVVEGGKN